MMLDKMDLRFNEEHIPVLVKEKGEGYAVDRRVNYNSPIRCYELGVRLGMASYPEEHVWVLAMDTAFHAIAFFDVSHGSMQMSVVDLRSVFMRLLMVGATTFIMFHNHPSGETAPSKEDKEITNRLHDSGQLLGIELADHIIIGDRNYYSFREGGVL